jgi:regulator of replication initiation timing
MKSMLMCLGVVALLAPGCDSSKQELETTKSTLSTMTKERDDLKAENTKLQQQLDATKAELAKATAPAAAAATTAAKTPAATDAKKAPAADKSKHHKS